MEVWTLPRDLEDLVEVEVQTPQTFLEDPDAMGGV